MKKIAHYSISLPSTSATEEARLLTDGGDLLLQLTCFDVETNELIASNIRFGAVRSFRYRGELYVTVWHIEDAYDTICEVVDSDWVAELKSRCVADWREYWEMRHFMIYLDSFGCLEVVSAFASIDEYKVSSRE